VSIDPQFFAAPPPGGGAQLTGVRVEFDSGAAVTLTAAAPQAAVELRIPLLARLMGETQAERYSYRVANLAGDAAAHFIQIVGHVLGDRRGHGDRRRRPFECRRRFFRAPCKEEREDAQ